MQLWIPNIIWRTKSPELWKSNDYRRAFLLELGKELIKPNTVKRLQNKDSHKSNVEANRVLVPMEETENYQDPVSSSSTISKRCWYVHEKKIREQGMLVTYARNMSVPLIALCRKE